MGAQELGEGANPWIKAEEVINACSMVGLFDRFMADMPLKTGLKWKALWIGAIENVLGTRARALALVSSSSSSSAAAAGGGPWQMAEASALRCARSAQLAPRQTLTLAR